MILVSSLIMELTVVIPTYNRANILKRTIDALFSQTILPGEIIVVNDGSTDNTKELIEKIKPPRRIKFLYLKQKNSGQGNARNNGIQHAQGEITLLLGDDIIAEKNLIQEHLQLHKKHPKTNEAVLGHIEWHPDLNLTPFMKWLTNGSCILGKYGGHQFAYEKLKGKERADHNFFYTSNISLKTDLLKKHPFDPEFQKYGWEDIELGYRLTKKENLKLYYAPKALAYHYHQMSEDAIEPRMRLIGQSAHIIQKKYPELKKIPSTKKRIIFKLVSNRIALTIFAIIKTLFPCQRAYDYYYYALSKKYFLKGLKS